MHTIAIFGGTFDPIHNGHLKTSIQIQSLLNFDAYFFLPCKVPAIKPSASATVTQRIEMLKIAIKNHPHFNLDLREIERETPSYMVETLESFRIQYPESSITLIVGYDSFLSLPKWFEWQRIPTLANLLVINREAYAQKHLDETLTTVLQAHQSINPLELLNYIEGRIAFYDAGNFHISSTEIRQALKENKHLDACMPEPVLAFIQEHRLYIN